MDLLAGRLCAGAHTHTRGKIKVVESDAAEGVCIGVSSGFKLNLTKGEEGEGRRRDSNARSSLPSSSGSVAVREIGKTFLAFRKGKLRGASSEEKESTREIKGRGEFYATLSFPFRTEGKREIERICLATSWIRWKKNLAGTQLPKSRLFRIEVSIIFPGKKDRGKGWVKFHSGSSRSNSREREKDSGCAKTRLKGKGVSREVLPL